MTDEDNNINSSAESGVRRDNRLTQEDIKALVENPNVDNKIKIIQKLSGQYNTSDFTEAQVGLAEEIFRSLISHAEVEVKKVLSENLMTSKNVPKDVVVSLAKDVEEVALPVLEFSEILGDEDLIDIIKSTESEAGQIAIANRGDISEQVSAALVETESESVVDSLMQNENAQISEKSYEKVVTSFPKSEAIVESMITIGTLPANIIERMVYTVSTAIQKKLERKYENSFKEINNFFEESGEVAASKFIGMQVIDRELVDLVNNLEKDNKLIESLHPVHGRLSQLLDGLEQVGKITPLSALAMGHLVLFAITLSRLTSVPYSNVKKLLSDRQGGLKALYERAELPPKMFDAVQFVAGIIDRMDREHKEKRGPQASDDLYLLMKNVVNESKGSNIRNLSHFVSMIQHHIKEYQENW